LNHNIVGPDKYPIRYSAGQAYVPFQYYWENDHALFIEPLAAAYYRSGNLGKSVEEYERLVSLTAGRLFFGDIYAKSFYILGKIAEQQGQEAKAIEHYQKFLDLWKDADVSLPEVEDAKKRLAAL
jgi:tetratricopeptide (TPR) repeat protein